MKFILLISSAVILLASCAGKHNVKEFSNGVFEVTYTGAEYESIGDIPHKIQLLAAYKAQENNCDNFINYNDSQNSSRHTAKMGMFSVRSTMSKLYKCATENEPAAVNTKEVIEIQESRFGSLR